MKVQGPWAGVRTMTKGENVQPVNRENKLTEQYFQWPMSLNQFQAQV